MKQLGITLAYFSLIFFSITIIISITLTILLS
jgi:hypothetical protein